MDQLEKAKKLIKTFSLISMTLFFDFGIILFTIGDHATIVHAYAIVFIAFAFVVFVIATIITTLLYVIRRFFKKNGSGSTGCAPAIAPVKLPRSRKKKIQAATELSRLAKLHYGWAIGADSVGAFVIWWNSAKQALIKLTAYRGKVPDFYCKNVDMLPHLDNDFQWKLRDAIERSKDLAIKDLNGDHRNNKTARFIDFKTDIERHANYFSEETQAFADSAIDAVSRVAGIDPVRSTHSQHISSSIDHIDHMEGHEFEHWCADLLIQLGYTDVSVTQGSGDQGVDVLAQKDGIKYAIQCKCYSSDLGNTPIQEIYAGKKIYGCHVGVVMTNRHFTKGGIAAAEKTGVLLWDRDWIDSALTLIDTLSQT